MATWIRVSDAASLGMHAMALLAAAPGRMSGRAIARALGASRAHLAKVLGRLERAGLVRGTRGPSGGFVLACPPARIPLAAIYTAVDGRRPARTCLLPRPVCDGPCLFGGIIRALDRRVSARLSRTTLADVRRSFRTCAATLPASRRPAPGNGSRDSSNIRS
jgi:Rrf2 family protein